MNTPLRRILVPCDGSIESEAVLGMLAPFARQEQSEVAVLYVAGAGQSPQGPPPRIDQLCQALRTLGIHAWMELREGKPAEQILAWAREKGVDLIAMTTHGHSGMRRVMLGSVAEDILRHTEVPVLITRPATPAHAWKRIVVALDGSPQAENVLRDAVELARISGAALELVQVALPVVSAAGLGEFPTLMPSEDPRPYLRRMAARVEAVGVQARPVALEGRAAPEILRHLEQEGAALVCLTTHGRTGLSRLLLGSIAEEVLRHAPCPVWIRRSIAAQVPVPV